MPLAYELVHVFAVSDLCTVRVTYMVYQALRCSLRALVHATNARARWSEVFRSLFTALRTVLQ